MERIYRLKAQTKMRIYQVFILFVFGTCVVVTAQTPSNVGTNRGDKFRIAKTATEWTYLIRNGRNVYEHPIQISSEEFNEDGKLIAESRFDTNGFEQRTTYKRVGNDFLAEVRFYDSKGKEVEAKTVNFISPANIYREHDLCQSFSIRSETIPQTTEERFYETCSDGSFRALIIVEHNDKGKPIREVRSDAKGRVWELVGVLDAAGDFKNFSFSVNDGIIPTYIQTIDYVELQKDNFGNLVGYTASMTDSNSSGRVVNQWRERKTIIYREVASEQPDNFRTN
jgi:hypothetical protein